MSKAAQKVDLLAAMKAELTGDRSVALWAAAMASMSAVKTVVQKDQTKVESKGVKKAGPTAG